MYFLFISPHFPHTYWEFCNRLKQNGVNVLAIADAPYESLSGQLKSTLTEYYRVKYQYAEELCGVFAEWGKELGDEVL